MKNPPAYSLIFAIVFMVGIMLISATAIQNTQEKVVYYRNIEASPQAKLAAESAVDLAINELKDFGPGYEGTAEEDDVFCLKRGGGGTFIQNCESYGRYQVFAHARKLARDNEENRWVTPIPNTGTAAPEDACPKLEGDDVEIDNAEDLNHSCNWNKLLVNRSVTIPLYSTDENGDTVLPTIDGNFVDWKLKMRTPCMNGYLDKNCGGGDRYLLDGDENDYENDDSIVLWQLIATVEEAGTGEEYQVVLVPDDETVDSFGDESRDTDKNTEIYESLLNGTSDGNHVVLRAESGNDPYQPIYDLTTGSAAFIPGGDTLLSLVLQLDIVHPLVEQITQESVPYLEWQFTTNGTNTLPFADTKSVVIGGGYFESGETTYFYPVELVRSYFAESFGTYVIGN